MELLHATARTLVEWILYCLLEGTALALFVWLLVRLLPRQNAGTRFMLWFSVLMAMVVLPFAGPGKSAMATSFQNGIVGHNLLILSTSWALIILSVWALFAAAALTRVAAGVWQVGRLRRSSKEIDTSKIGPEILNMVAGCSRPVSIRLSDHVQIPTAISFLKPAIVMPCWFLEEVTPAELKQVLLHELTHLRRRDDWTNLAQKVVGAFLFFHPFAWWVERRLSLEREMACDDAVLAQSGSPHEYANCLRRVAEKSFVRRQLALAQAMVNRMRQLSIRVTQILAADRTHSTRLWKPAVPIVLVAASLCGVSAWHAPAIVGFRDDGKVSSSAPASPTSSAVAAATGTQVKRAHLLLATLAKPKSIVNAKRSRAGTRSLRARSFNAGDYVVSKQFVVTMTSAQNNWQVELWQVRVLLPRKTISRKNI